MFSRKGGHRAIDAQDIFPPLLHTGGSGLGGIVPDLLQGPLAGKALQSRYFLCQQPRLVIAAAAKALPAERNPGHQVRRQSVFLHAGAHKLGIDAIIRRCALKLIPMQGLPHVPCIIQRREANRKTGNLLALHFFLRHREPAFTVRAEHSPVRNQLSAEGAFRRVKQIQQSLPKPLHFPQASRIRIRSAL